MPPSTDFYTTHAAVIESALAQASRSHRLAPDAADEFCSWARLRLLDHDQAILRKFAGRSQLRTFLITVVQRLYLDWRNAEWGKWRPTAEARRLGLVAIELERLVLRDSLVYDEAAQTLAARGIATADDCERVWVQLPRRPRRKRVDEDDMAALPSPLSASETVDDDEARAEATAMCAALARALNALPPADQVLLQLRFFAGHTVARIAALTGADQKALYRRFDLLKSGLRARLETEGLSREALAKLTGRFESPDDADHGSGNVAAAEFLSVGPSTVTTGGQHG